MKDAKKRPLKSLFASYLFIFSNINKYDKCE